jgi:putative transposase
MGAVVPSYKGFRFPVEIISHCVWLYHRFPLSFREVEEMMMERGVEVPPVARTPPVWGQ